MEPRRDRIARRRGRRRSKSSQERFERRGQLAEQLKTLADDRQLARKQLDLAIVEQRLEDAVRRWQVLAVTCRTLDPIRSTLRAAAAAGDAARGVRATWSG